MTIEVRRLGVAYAAAFECVADGSACPEIWVATEPDNLPARSLYESRGARAEPAVMYVYRL